MKLNVRPTDTDYRKDKDHRTAGGYGPYAAKQGPEALLRRSVMACLLWEKLAYEDGKEVVENIKNLIPLVDPATVAAVAVEARTIQKLRHVPLLIAREMARLQDHKGLVGDLLPRIILRADELAEFLALYWKDGKEPLSKQVKLGLAQAFDSFDQYQFAKYNRDAKISLRDVMFLVHPHPPQGKEELYKQIADNTLPTPDTWEVSLSAGANKADTWSRLIANQKLGPMAFLRNLRNMESAGVSPSVIRQGFKDLNTHWLLPLNFLAAEKAVPKYGQEIEEAMLRGLDQGPKLPGYTIFVIDASGSMNAVLSDRSRFDRLDAATAMAILAASTCEYISIYVTAGNDYGREHATVQISPYKGFALRQEIEVHARVVGRGGIFTRQCLEYIKAHEREQPNRIIIFSDSEDCDHPDSRIPAPFGKNNYIIDVSAHSRGINYEGLWTAEISGWSEHFLKYIAALEGQENNEND